MSFLRAVVKAFCLFEMLCHHPAFSGVNIQTCSHIQQMRHGLALAQWQLFITLQGFYASLTPVLTPQKRVKSLTMMQGTANYSSVRRWSERKRLFVYALIRLNLCGLMQQTGIISSLWLFLKNLYFYSWLLTQGKILT